MLEDANRGGRACRRVARGPALLGAPGPSAIIGPRARATARPKAGMTPRSVAPGTSAHQIRERCQT